MGNELYLEKLRHRPILPTTTEIMFDPESPGFIGKNDSVLVVGPGIQTSGQAFKFGPVNGIPMDRSLMVLPHRLSQGIGQITVLDAPITGVAGFGEHSLDLVQRWIEYISAKIPTCPIEYVEGVLLQDTFVFPKEFDAVIDHLTTYDWIMRNAGPVIQEEAALQMGSFYSSILRPGGKLLMYYSKDSPLRVEALERALMTDDFLVDTIDPLNDVYEMPLELENELRSFGYFPAGINSLNQLQSYHPSQGLFVGQKQT